MTSNARQSARWWANAPLPRCAKRTAAAAPLQHREGTPDVEIVVNGSLLRVQSGGGIRIDTVGVTSAAVAHVLCLSHAGCMVQVAGQGVRALAYGEVAAFAQPQNAPFWLAFRAIPPPASAAHNSTPLPPLPLAQEAAKLPSEGPRLFALGTERADLARLARLAADGGTIWRTTAISFSTMIRFLQRFSSEVCWHRHPDSGVTIVEWAGARPVD